MTAPTRRSTAARYDSLAAHTLVIPTYNRPALLERLVTYYVERAAPLKLLVLDSSRSEISQQNAAFLAQFSGNLRHIIFDVTTPMARKLAEGLEVVATPTASLCADDDLVFPAALVNAIAFLERCPDYATAHGVYLNFSEQGRTIAVTTEYAGPSNEADHPGARFFRLCQKYESLFYGVFRTGDLRTIFGEAAQIPTLHYQELFQSAAALIIGKVKRFPEYYAARRSGPAAEPDRDKWQTYYWFANNPTEMVEHYVTYRKQLFSFYERHIAQGSQGQELDERAFGQVFDICHAMYFSINCPPRYFHSVLQHYWPQDAFVEERTETDDAPVSLKSSPAGGGRLQSLRALRFLTRLSGIFFERATSRRMPALRSLDQEIADVCNQPWRLQVQRDLEGPLSDSDFRSVALELCRYLDSAAA